MHRTCICIVVLAVACLGMASAQSFPNAQAQDQPKPCDPPHDIRSLASATLAQEWLNPDAVANMLRALRLYIKGGERNVREALDALVKAAPGADDLYRAAQGRPDEYGQPTAQGVSDFLDMLTKANTQCTQNMTGAKKDELFKAVSDLIEFIYMRVSNGKQALVKINDLFVQGDKHRALCVLLTILPVPGENDNVDQYVHALEIFRAAYEQDTDRLATLVGTKISAQKK